MLLLPSLIILLFVHLCPSISQPCTAKLSNLELNKQRENKDQFGCVGCNNDEANKNVSSDVKIYLFTRSTGENYTELIFGNTATISTLNSTKVCKILIHGWRGSSFTNFEETVRKTYLSAQDVNVIQVDWSKLSHEIYDKAKAAVVPIGMFLAQFLDWLLLTETNMSVDNIHIIGHSLGAHISGVIGEYLTVGQVGRITGLDPAGPGFSNSSTTNRLDASDAQFVDIIHTDGGVAGFFDPCGDVDFYPNKGRPQQPGCVDLLVCSHIRAYQFFNESIISDQFVSTSCDNWKNFSNDKCSGNLTTPMGEKVDLTARGNYYLHTDGSYPYALGNDSTNYERELRRKPLSKLNILYKDE